MDQDARYLFRPEYRWPTGKKAQPQPFFVFPAWWRRFIFHVLNPRALSVYLYYLSIMRENGIAFPTIDQIAHDLGLSDKESIRRAIGRLVECGFLIKPTPEHRLAHKMGTRPIYQRPCTQFTLRELLEIKEIDGELYPRNSKLHSEHSRSSDSVVQAGLKFLLDDHYAYYQHALAQSGPDRGKKIKDVLLAILNSQLREMEEFQKESIDAAVTELDDETIKEMPPEIRTALGIPEKQKEKAQKKKPALPPKRSKRKSLR